MLRIVVDTNSLVSGVLSAGLPRRLIDGARAGAFELCTSEELLAELLDVLARDKFAARLARARFISSQALTPEGIVGDLRCIAVAVTPVHVPRVVRTDPDDDHVLAASLAGDVDCIASGDKRDLLALGSCQGIPILDVHDAPRRLDASREV